MADPQHRPPEYTGEISDAEKMRRLPWSYLHNAANSAYAVLTFFGPVFILFLDELGLAKTRIGFLLSLLPFCGLVAPFIAPAVARAGVKRVYLLCWGARKGVTAGLLLVPWVLRQQGEGAAFLLVATVVALFALLRAVGETAWYPWVQELVPRAYRGQYTAINRIASLLAGSMCLFGASYALDRIPGVHRFTALIGIGVLAGFLCVLFGLKMPGGAPDKPRRAGPSPPMLGVLRDTRFLIYMAYTALALLTVHSMLMAFVPLFMKEQVGLSERQIILLQVGSSLSGLVSSYGWGFLADRHGSRPVLRISLAALLVLPIGWSLIPRFHFWSFPVALALGVFAGVASSGWWISDQRLLYVDLLEPEKRTQYMAMYYAWIGLVGGCGPLLAGVLLDTFSDLHGYVGFVAVHQYTPLFAASGLLLAAAAVLLSQLRLND